MNYIELIRDFWRSHERYSFGVTEIALYFHLIEICNICNWENPFRRNNARICADLSITLNTLKNARNKLKQSSLIDFESIQGNPNVKYELKRTTSSKFDEVRDNVSIEVSIEVPTKLIPTKDKLNKTKQNEYSFDVFWNLYDKKVGKKEKVKKKWEKLSLDTQKEILEYLPKYKEAEPNKQFRKNPETFFNNESWNDEIIKPSNDKKNNRRKPNIANHNNEKKYEQF